MSITSARRRMALLLSGAALAGLAAAGAIAQPASVASATEATPEEPAEGDIIVTAQKREQRLQDVPISVAVVSGSKLQDSSIKNFQDLSNYVPNLFVSKTPGADQIIMRGIGSGAGSPSLDQSVVMFIDGVFAGNARQFTAPFMDIERMEVLRGPQGALVGKNTSAGAINIISKRPGRNLEGFVLGEYDFNLNAPKVEGAVTVPLAEGFGIRAAGKYSDADGWITNRLNSNRREPARKEQVGRLTLGYNSGGFDAALKGEISKVRVRGNPFVIVSRIAGRLPDRSKETSSRYGPEYDEVKAQSAVLNLAYTFDSGYVVASISGYSGYKSDQREDADFFERDLAYATFQEDYKQYSQELRLLSPTGGTFEWGVGAYYSDANLTEERTTSVNTAPNANTYRRFLQDTTVTSFYGTVTVRPVEQFWIVGSLRNTREKKRGDFAQFGGTSLLPVNGNGTVLQRTISDRFKDNQLDPSLTLQFRPNRDLMVYGSYLRGSKSGGFQGAISNALASSFRFAPETSRSFELGAKISFAGRGYLNFDVFDTRYKNLQLSTAIQTTSVTSFSFFTSNAGSASVRGAELDGLYRFNDNFAIDGSFAWTPRARYNNYPAGPCYTGRPATNPTQGSCSLTGFRLGFVPKFVSTLTPRVTVPVGDALKVNASTTLIYRTSAFMDSTGDPISIQRRFAKLDARIGVGAADDRWEVALLGRNLTNKTTISFSGAASLASNPAVGLAPDARQQGIDLPRTIAVQARMKF